MKAKYAEYSEEEREILARKALEAAHRILIKKCGDSEKEYDIQNGLANVFVAMARAIAKIENDAVNLKKSSNPDLKVFPPHLDYKHIIITAMLCRNMDQSPDDYHPYCATAVGISEFVLFCGAMKVLDTANAMLLDLDMWDDELSSQNLQFMRATLGR